MTAFDGLAVLLFFLPVPGWAATLILLSAALRRPRIAALTERAFASVILSGAASLAAALGFARLGRVPVDRDLATLVLAAICLAVSVPALLWLAKFVRGDFGRGDE